MSESLHFYMNHGETRLGLATEDVVEIPLLLSGRLADILETAAHDRGLTAAEMVRRLLCESLLHTKRK